MRSRRGPASSIEKKWALAERFFAAMQDGDTEGLADYLAQDVVLYADGGGKAPAIPEPIRGAPEAAPFLTDLGRTMLAEGISLVLADVNGQPGAIAKNSSGLMIAAISIDIVSDRVHATWAVTNPDKLGHIPFR